jgi:hypothetical protein
MVEPIDNVYVHEGDGVCGVATPVPDTPMLFTPLVWSPFSVMAPE